MIHREKSSQMRKSCGEWHGQETGGAWSSQRTAPAPENNSSKLDFYFDLFLITQRLCVM